MSQNNQLHTVKRQLRIVSILAACASLMFIWLIVEPDISFFKGSTNKPQSLEVSDGDIIDGIHVQTGLIDDEGMMAVINNCTSCHSSKLVIQNRMDKDRWNATINWMQETQNLWELGGNREIIVNYLVKNYPPVEKGRRENIANIEWYELK